MRGEEVQIAGWKSIADDTENSLVCLPGTHTKWAHIMNNQIASFTTSPTGEFYAVLKEHSILVGDDETDFDASSFQQGVDVALTYGGSLLHTVFSTRSRSLVAPNEEFDAASYLSGLLIGTDVQTALNQSDTFASPIQLIGEPALCEKFAVAIHCNGRECRVFDGAQSAYNGFMAIAGIEC